MKVEFIVGDCAALVAQQRKEWEHWAPMYGLKGIPFGARFGMNGHEYEVVGIEPRRRTRPVVAKRTMGGKRFVFTTEQVRLRFPLEGGTK